MIQEYVKEEEKVILHRNENQGGHSRQIQFFPVHSSERDGRGSLDHVTPLFHQLDLSSAN